MARVFLDTNIFVDLVEERSNKSIENFNEHQLFISPLSFHILMYVTKQKIPYLKLNEIKENFQIVSFGEDILMKLSKAQLTIWKIISSFILQQKLTVISF